MASEQNEEAVQNAGAPVAAPAPAPTQEQPAQAAVPVLPAPVGVSVPVPLEERPKVKTEMTPTADGGYRVTERTEVSRQFAPPPTARTYPTVHYGTQPQSLLQRPLPPPGIHPDGGPLENISAARYFDDCAESNECVEWEVEIRRQSPDKWPKSKTGKPLRIGELARWPIDNFASLRKRVIDTFGGGKFKLALRDEDNHVRRTIEINASPMSNPPCDPELETEEEAPMIRTPVETKPAEMTEIEKVKIQKELIKQEAELEITKGEIEIKKEELARKREARDQANPQIDALREEMRSSKDQTSLLLKAIQDQATQAAQQTRELITALTNKPDNSKDILVAMQQNMTNMMTAMAGGNQARTEREDQARREQEERRERERKEQSEREERHRQEQSTQQQQFVTMILQMSESRNKESVPQMNMLMESIKALNEGNKTFIQAVIETGKSNKGDLAETQKANTALVERTFQVITEAQKGDAGKYERLMEALISNKLESGQRGLDDFMKIMQLGESRGDKLFQVYREAQEGLEEEQPEKPTIDTNQGFWNNLGNIVMALLLSRSGNPEVQQGVAAALGRTNPAALTQGDYRQVAQGLTPLVGQQMGMQMPNGMIPMPQQQPVPQLSMATMGSPDQQMLIPMPQQQPRPQAQVPFQIPQPPVQRVQQVQAPQQPPVQMAQPTDAESTERLRATLDEMVETACNDLSDETREQQWVDYGLDYLPKSFLNSLVQCLEAKRLDMAVALIRQNTTVDRFMRLEGLVQNQAKYDLFMKSLIEMIEDHRDTAGGTKPAIPITSAQTPVQAAPIPVPQAPVPMAPVPPATVPPITVPTPPQV